uniref:E3 ubiquitin ligase TRAF3IP2 n=1 Tax=Callorhinchus milii TaxID=7868 RepID=V9KUF1_CALMI
MLRFVTPLPPHVNSPGNGPEENDETDSGDSLLNSESESFVPSPMPRFCGEGWNSDSPRQSYYLPVGSKQGLTESVVSNHYPASLSCSDIRYTSPAGHGGMCHDPRGLGQCGDCFSSESAGSRFSNRNMIRFSQSFRPNSLDSSPSTLGLCNLEPGFPLQSYQPQPPGPLLPDYTNRPRVSVYVPAPGQLPCTPPCRAYYVPHRTPGDIHPNGPENVSLPRPVGSTDRVNQSEAFSLPLPREQRKVFVTYATDDDRHVEEVIKFVSLLITNGFETQIDVFEQHFRSINKIDWMERYINDKGYLIIIVISPKYHETVTSQSFQVKSDEHSLNAVFIYKQLQNEFIQNGSKNFRFVPVLFPGASMKHVPSWLQNTHVYNWPQQSQDILRRLMRLEKYNPPPVGALPTIIQKSI